MEEYKLKMHRLKMHLVPTCLYKFHALFSVSLCMDLACNHTSLEQRFLFGTCIEKNDKNSYKMGKCMVNGIYGGLLTGTGFNLIRSKRRSGFKFNIFPKIKVSSSSY